MLREDTLPHHRLKVALPREVKCHVWSMDHVRWWAHDAHPADVFIPARPFYHPNRKIHHRENAQGINAVVASG